MKKPFFLLIPFLLLMALVLASIWNVLTQSLGYIPAFGSQRADVWILCPGVKGPGIFKLCAGEP